MIGQPRRREGAQRVFHRALNYASLSFHQPHTGRQIKDASAEVLPSRLSRRWEDKSRAGRFVTRSATQQVRCITMSVEGDYFDPFGSRRLIRQDPRMILISLAASEVDLANAVEALRLVWRIGFKNLGQNDA